MRTTNPVVVSTRLSLAEAEAVDVLCEERKWSRSQLMRQVLLGALKKQGWVGPRAVTKIPAFNPTPPVDGVYTSGEVFDNLAAKAGDNIPIINDLAPVVAPFDWTADPDLTTEPVEDTP